MSWECKLIDVVGTKMVTWTPPPGGGVCGETYFVDKAGTQLKLKQLPIGTMFYLPRGADLNEWPWYMAKPDNLSDQYQRENYKRQPLFVVLPGDNLFVVDSKCFKDGKRYGGWTVTGVPPKITVRASIDLKGRYHGFITDGIIGDDVEGRKYG